MCSFRVRRESYNPVQISTCAPTTVMWWCDGLSYLVECGKQTGAMGARLV